VAWRFERVAGPFEGPAAGLAWDGRGMLFCVLSPGVRAGEGRILRYDAKSGDAGVYRAFTNRTTGIAFGPDGALYGCQSLSRRVVRFDPEGSTSLTATRLDGRRHNVPESLAIDSRGRIWFTDARSELRTSGPQIFPMTEPASVLLLEKNSSRQWALKRAAFDVSKPAAVALSPDEKTLYVGDGSELRSYVLKEDELEGGQRLQSLPGTIKGLCVERNGDVLACAGAAILALLPSGALRESRAFPEGEPVSCAFGGTDLYVTTAAGELWRTK
jgi:gluconolactonase